MKKKYSTKYYAENREEICRKQKEDLENLKTNFPEKYQERLAKRATYHGKTVAGRGVEATRSWILRNPEKKLLNSSRNHAKTGGWKHNITEKDIIIPEYCPILGIKLEWIFGRGRNPTSPSLDRIDSSRGYVKGNVWVISEKANRMKNNASIDELVLFAKGILKNFDKR